MGLACMPSTRVLSAHDRGEVYPLLPPNCAGEQSRRTASDSKASEGGHQHSGSSRRGVAARDWAADEVSLGVVACDWVLGTVSAGTVAAGS